MSHLCYSSRVHATNRAFVVSTTQEQILFQETVNDLKKKVKSTKNDLNNKINHFTLSLYGKTIKYSHNIISEIWYKIKPFMENIEQIKKDIQKALGYKASFWQNGKPILLKKIVKAWELSKQNARFILIEKELYGC